VFMGLRATTFDLSRTFELAYAQQDPTTGQASRGRGRRAGAASQGEKRRATVTPVSAPTGTADTGYCHVTAD